MAIGIDNVYQQVLAIANKEQRGYITPQEFNLFARKAQNDIFEKTFVEYKDAFLNPASVMQSHKNLDMLRDKMNPFRELNKSINVDGSGKGTLSTLGVELITNPDFDNAGDWTANGQWAVSTADNNATIDGAQTTAETLVAAISDMGLNKSYRVKFTVTGLTAGSFTVSIMGVQLGGSITSNGEYVLDGTTPGTAPDPDTVDLVFTADEDLDCEISNTSVREISNNLAEDVYWMESVYHFGASGVDSCVFEEIDKKRVNFLEKYKTQTGFPLNIDHLIFDDSAGLKFSTINTYYREGTATLVFYPVPVDSSGNAISPKCDYVRTIASYADPKWGFQVLNGKALYNAGTSDDFVIHSSEEGNLVNKILELAGISLMKPDLSQSALQNQATNMQQQVQKSYQDPVDNTRTTFLQDQFPYGNKPGNLKR